MDLPVLQRGYPPFDNFIEEAFFEKRCGINETHSSFYKWCIDPLAGQPSNWTKCEGLSRQEDLPCEVKVTFFDYVRNSLRPRYASVNEDKHNVSQEIPPRPKIDKHPTILHYAARCTYRDTHQGFWKMNITIKEKEFKRITEICFNEFYGIQPPATLAWLLILIAVIVIMTACIAFFIFWKFFLSSIPQNNTLEADSKVDAVKNSDIQSFEVLSPLSQATTERKLSTGNESKMKKSKSRQESPVKTPRSASFSSPPRYSSSANR